MVDRAIARRIAAASLAAAMAVLFINLTFSEAKSSALAAGIDEPTLMEMSVLEGFEIQAAGQSQEPNKYVAELRKQIAGQENKPAEEVFKNIQLLKGMPAGRMLNIMDMGFGRGLGVDCTHCHVEGEWEKDDKETKKIARNMWNFMRKVNDELKVALNNKPNVFVNCTTCHRGQPNPNAPPSK